MKVVLKATVPKVGKEGQVVRVADGFARNYLFPKGLAVYADRKQIGVIEARLAKLAEQDASTLEGAQKLKEKLDGKMLSVEAKSGHGTTKLFGAVTSQNIVDLIKSELGVSVEKKQVALIDPIKRLGTHVVHLDLHRSVDATVTVRVFDPTAPVEEPESLLTEEQSEPEAAIEAPATAEPKKAKRDKKEPADEESASAEAAPEESPEEPAEAVEA
jgi:large subunit ribosomal protein L9